MLIDALESRWRNQKKSPKSPIGDLAFIRMQSPAGVDDFFAEVSIHVDFDRVVLEGRGMRLPFLKKAIRIGDSDTALEAEVKSLKEQVLESGQIIEELRADNDRLRKRVIDLVGTASEKTLGGTIKEGMEERYGPAADETKFPGSSQRRRRP